MCFLVLPHVLTFFLSCAGSQHNHASFFPSSHPHSLGSATDSLVLTSTTHKSGMMMKKQNRCWDVKIYIALHILCSYLSFCQLSVDWIMLGCWQTVDQEQRQSNTLSCMAHDRGMRGAAHAAICGITQYLWARRKKGGRRITVKKKIGIFLLVYTTSVCVCRRRQQQHRCGEWASEKGENKFEYSAWYEQLSCSFIFLLVDFEIDVFDSLTVLPFAFGMTWKDSFVFESKITFIVTRTLCTGIEMSHQNLCEHDHPFLLLLFNGASHSILAVYIRTTTVKVYVGFFMLPSFPLLYIFMLRVEAVCVAVSEKRGKYFVRIPRETFSTLCNVDEQAIDFA